MKKYDNFNFLLALLSFRIFFLDYKDPETGERFTDIAEYDKKDKQVFTGNITLNDLPWRLVLNISETACSEATLSPSLSLTEEKVASFKALLPTVNAALPFGTEAFLHGNRPEFIVMSRDKDLFYDDYAPHKMIGSLLASSAACIKTFEFAGYRPDKVALIKEIVHATQEFMEYIADYHFDLDDDTDLSEDEDITDIPDSDECIDAFLKQIYDEGFYPEDEEVFDEDADASSPDIVEDPTGSLSKIDYFISLFENHLEE